MMERFVIKIRPATSDDAKLVVADAMQQVLDALAIFEDAQRGLGAPEGAFEWRLESASTNSPFTVTAIAESINPSVDAAPYARRVKHEVSVGMRKLLARGQPPHWMSPKALTSARHLFERTLNNVGSTEIDFEAEADGLLLVDSSVARAGADAIDAMNVLDVADSLPERQAFGEIEGVMVAAGRYRNVPALQIRTELYGFVWCVLSDDLIAKFGDDHNIRELWEGKTVAVYAKLSYAKGGKLSKTDAFRIREIRDAPFIDLDTVLDPDFTAGNDPHEYLIKLHAGKIG
jgi:hypothetical protein